MCDTHMPLELRLSPMSRKIPTTTTNRHIQIFDHHHSLHAMQEATASNQIETYWTNNEQRKEVEESKK